MTLKEKIAFSKKRPKAYVEETVPLITFSTEDDIEEIICLMMATAYQGMPDLFYKLVGYVGALPDLYDHLDYMYYYHLSLASFYKHSGDSSNAIEHCLRSNDIAYRMNDNGGVVQSYRFLGSVYLNDKDYDNATYYSICAIKELPQCEDFALCADVYNLYGVISVEVGKYDYAIQAYNNAFDFIKNTSDYEEDVLYYLLHLNYGEALMLNGQEEASETYYLKAIELSDKYNHECTYGNMLLMLINYYKKNENFEKACYYYDKYINKNNEVEAVSVLLNEKSSKEALKKELSQMKRLRDTNQILLKRLNQMHRLTDKTEVKSHIELQHRLTLALEKGHIITYFQGKWSLKQNRIVGAEALIRWRDDTTLIPPVAFITKVENTEMIIELSKKVIKDSIKLCKHIVDTINPDFIVSINIAPYQLEHQDLSKFIQGELLLNKLKAKHIEIEITERSFINQSPSIIDQLHKLQEMGLTLSLDDFGTGYSSLSYIKDYNFNCIKLDKSLLDRVTTDVKAFDLLSGILSMFQALHIDTVVEGVETREQEQILKSLNCDYLQGYYYDRPVCEEDFLDRLKS